LKKNAERERGKGKEGLEIILKIVKNEFKICSKGRSL